MPTTNFRLDRVEAMKIRAGVDKVGTDTPDSHSQPTAKKNTLQNTPQPSSQHNWAHTRLEELLSSSTPAQTLRIINFLIHAHDHELPKKTELPWPSWDGKPESLNCFLYEIEVKIEEDRHELGSNRAICYRMLGTIPSAKKKFVSSWFQRGGDAVTYDWREFLGHFKKKFEDKKCHIEARNAFMHMTQGAHQYFKDFIEDFETKLSQCGGDDWDSFTKIAMLDAKLNPALQKYLIPVTRPEEWDYSQWVERLKEISARLEVRQHYRPNEVAETNTHYMIRQAAPEVEVANPTTMREEIEASQKQGCTEAGINNKIRKLPRPEETTIRSASGNEKLSPKERIVRVVLEEENVKPSTKEEKVKEHTKEEKSKAPTRKEKGKAPIREEKGRAPIREEKSKSPIKEEKVKAPARDEHRDTSRNEGIERSSQPDGHSNLSASTSEISATSQVKDLSVKSLDDHGAMKVKSYKPRAPWRSKKEFHMLMHKRLCIRCKRPGHIARYCRFYRPPLYPAHEEECENRSEIENEKISEFRP